MRKASGYVLVLVVASMLLGTSCKFQKLLKSSDNDLKYKTAKELYDEGNYIKAMTLLEQLIPIYRGTEKGEEVSYLYAYCNYHIKDYILAGHYFRRFSNGFPNSKFAEESSYMSAYCYYLDAPKPSLDQETTYEAIKEFQLYLGRYPDNNRVLECNDLIDELTARLEEKSYHNAMHYYKVEMYKAAGVALKNSLEEFPDSKFREDILYHLIKTYYKYAQKSIYGKKEERLEEAKRAYVTFIKSYPQSKYGREVERIYSDISKKLEFHN